MPRLPNSAAPVPVRRNTIRTDDRGRHRDRDVPVPGLVCAQLFPRWLGSWGISWALLLPVVITAAPFIRKAVATVTERP